ncbi:uncharacterized protein [Dermacentor albipictus]|uniref:uncharacterized protein n=1 Tax=Dermacentor albipictus TaxID=60249 RepID=UPI0038FC311A
MSFDPPSANCSPTDAEEAVCLVSHGLSKKVVKLAGARKLADLHESLRTGGFTHLMKGGDLLIQIFNHRFQCNVDMDESTRVHDGALINLVVSPSNSEASEAPRKPSLLACAHASETHRSWPFKAVW